MAETGRGLLGLLLILLLSGCFLVPGEFTSNLDIRKDGTFSFAYKGQIVIALPDEMGPGGSSGKPKAWSDSMAQCFKTGQNYYSEYDGPVPPPPAPTTPSRFQADDASQAMVEEPDGVMTADEAVPPPVVSAPASESDQRPCKPAEIAKLKKDFETAQADRIARKQKESEQMAAMFGLGPNDDANNRKVAAELTKYAGWKSVTYVGKGVYNVDYQLTGRVGHDFIFPVFPKGDIMIPFVTMRARGDGTALISAPALSGSGFKGLASRMSMLGAAGAGRNDMPQTSVVTKGTFTVTTDGVPLTNNTDDGPVAGTAGQTLTWMIDNNSEKVPEALIRLR